jgi:hypothetical protein
LAEEKKQREKEEQMKRNKKIRCKFLFEQGSCRMGDKCFYSHEGFNPAETKQDSGSSTYRGGMARGMRGGRPVTSTPFSDSSDHSARIPSGASRGGRGGHYPVRREEMPMAKKPKVQKKQDCSDLNS